MTRHVLLEFEVQQSGIITIELGEVCADYQIKSGTPVVLETSAKSDIKRLIIRSISAHVRFMAAKFDRTWKENLEFQTRYPQLYQQIHNSNFDLTEFGEHELQVIEQHDLFVPSEQMEFTSWQDYRSQPRINQRPISQSSASLFGRAVDINPGDIFSCNLVIPEST